MAIYVYNTTTGELYSYSPNDTDPVASSDILVTKGLSIISGLPQLGPTVVWDAMNKTTKTVTPPPAPQPIGTGKWILRFTPQEFQTISASADATVQQFLYALNHTTEIDLADPVITGGVAYLVAVGLLGQARVAAVLVRP